MKNVTKFEVASNSLLSDHYPLLWSYKVAAFTPEARQKQVGEKPLRWSDEKKAATSIAVDSCLDQLTATLNGDGDLSSITEHFSSVLYEAVKPCLQVGAKPDDADGGAHAAGDEDDAEGDIRHRACQGKQPLFCYECARLRDIAMSHLEFLRPDHGHGYNKERLIQAYL